MKLFKDVLPAAASITTVAANFTAIRAAVRHPKAAAKKAIQKVKGQK